MEIINKFVLFEKYCSTCIHKDKKDHEDPCNECLENAVNTQSEKPVMYNSKLKTTTNNNTNVQYIKVYPELENITVVPSLEEQKIKSKNYYGINEVTVTAIEGEELSVIPSTEKQTYEGLYTTVNVEGFDKGTDTTDATATAEDILEGKTAYVNDNKITGTMSNNGTLNYIPSTQDQTIPAGYTSGGTIEGVTANIDENIKPENIKKDVEILGVVGSLEESSGTTEDSEIELSYLSSIDDSLGKNVTKLPERITSIGQYAFNGRTNLALTELPEGITSIGQHAFNGCSNLSLTKLPNNLTSIDSSVFYKCSNVALTKLPNNLTFIGQYAFYECSNLALTELPEGLTDINYSVFYKCLSLTEMTCKGITSIGSNAFYGCKNLSKIIFTNITVVPTLSNKNTFSNTPIASGTGYVYVPDDLVGSFKTATNWSNYANQIKAISELEG